MAKDIWFELDMGDGIVVPVTPRQIENVGKILLIETRRQMSTLADLMIQELRTLYKMRDRERIDGREPFSRSVERGLRKELEYIRQDRLPEFEMRLLDIERIRSATMYRGRWGRPAISVFDILESGSNRVYRSKWFGFIPYEMARSLADKCVTAMGIEGREAAEFKSHVDDVFRGRHGDGIMVRLNKPLFFRYPQFGTALENGVKPDGGFTAFNIYHEMMQNDTGHGRPLSIPGAMSWAIEATKLRIARGEGR